MVEEPTIGSEKKVNAKHLFSASEPIEEAKLPRIIYEDKNFVAVYKPAGLLTHPARISGEPTLIDWLLRRYPEMNDVGDPSTDSGQAHRRPGLVHRLDRDTSGILLAARNQRYFEELKSLFKKRKIKKTYLALVFGRPKERKGLINAPIKLKSGTVKRTIFRGKMTKEARTHYMVKKTFRINGGEFSLLEIVPETGRTHQIRVHLASIGCPVVGDRLYGPKRQPSWASRLMLHAYSLEFSTEEGKRIKIEAEPPEGFARCIMRNNKYIYANDAK